MYRKKRLNELIKKFEKNNIDALLVTKSEDVFYLTSFYAERIALVVNTKKCFLVIDFVYAEAAAKHIRGFNLLLTDGDFAKTIAGELDRYKIKKIGFDSLSLPFALYKDIKGVLKRKKFTPTENIVGSLRQIKDGREIIALKKALKITKKSFQEIKKRIKPGLTELSVSNYIKELFIKNGADGPSFKPIVATQPGASEPHHAAAIKRLRNNKAVLVDMGAKLKGYNSDLTRMCPLGKISSKFVRLSNIVLDAQKKAIERIRPGVKISYIDSVARQHIVSKGLGKFFGHGLGHGIGLEIHERPYITAKSKGILKAGMVFTVEPAIYIPSYGGIRVEDMVRVHTDGCEVLTGDINKSI